jgi:MerR family transcriptional regulator, redox-sensitive transcriptional activator SoxR
MATSALRYYERIGLLPPAERGAGGRRHFHPSSAERVALVRLYQDAGFTLKEIRQQLAADTRGRGSWSRQAERKIDELDARIAEARGAKKLLEHALNLPPSRPSQVSPLPLRARSSSRGGLVAHQLTVTRRGHRQPCTSASKTNRRARGSGTLAA